MAVGCLGTASSCSLCPQQAAVPTPSHPASTTSTAPGHRAPGKGGRPPGAAGTANLATPPRTRRTSTTVRERVLAAALMHGSSGAVPGGNLVGLDLFLSCFRVAFFPVASGWVVLEQAWQMQSLYLRRLNGDGGADPGPRGARAWVEEHSAELWRGPV